MGWTDALKKHRPKRNSHNESCRIKGRKAAISDTCHFARLGYSGLTDRYSRSHCLTSIEYDAAIKLNIKLANHNTFTRIAAVDGSKDEELRQDAAVEFKKLGLMV